MQHDKNNSSILRRKKTVALEENNSRKGRGDFAKELSFILKIRQGIMFCFARVYTGLNTQKVFVKYS